jgi:hypothetical protein
MRALRPAGEATQAAPQGRALIVVIGIDEYTFWPRLNNAVNDALGVHKLFVETLGFIAPLPPLLNAKATAEAISALVRDQLPQILHPEDSLLLFFAGHGHTRRHLIGDQESEIGYLIPVDAPTDHFGHYIKLDSFLEDVSLLPAQHVLVILDACHSGLALNVTTRTGVRYERDLAARLSRKVITSAQSVQVAQDGGPVAGHSLFAGTLIDGLNWGKADGDGNSLVTSSELGLYLQQQVGQWSRSQQTPAFGAFSIHDKQGEMVISLGDDNFDALKARTFAALQQGNLTSFYTLAEQVVALRPASPEALYLHYRSLLAQGAIGEAIAIVERLLRLDLRRGTIPLSAHDLGSLHAQLIFWQRLLSLAGERFPLAVTLLAGGDEAGWQPLAAGVVGEMAGYPIEPGSVLRFQLANQTPHRQHVYLIEIDAEGRLAPLPLWQDDMLWNGLEPGQTATTYPFQGSTPGLYEYRLFASPTRVPLLMAAPAPATRGLLGPQSLDPALIEAMTAKTMRCLYLASPTGAALPPGPTAAQGHLLKLVRQVYLVPPEALPPSADQEAMLSAIARALAGQGWVEITDDRRQADFQVAVDRQGRYEIRDAIGQPFPNLSLAQAESDPPPAEQVAQRLVGLARYHNILAWENRDPLSPLAGKLAVELLSLPPDYDPATEARPQPFAGQAKPPALPAPTWVYLRIRNQYTATLNVSVFDLQPDWGVAQIWPPAPGALCLLAPSQEIGLPFQVWLAPAYEEGIDIIKVFARLGTASPHWLALPPLTGAPAITYAAVAHPAGAAGSLDPLEQLLAALTLTGPSLRTVDLTTYRGREYVTAQLSLRLIQRR